MTRFERIAYVVAIVALTASLWLLTQRNSQLEAAAAPATATAPTAQMSQGAGPDGGQR